MNARFLLNKVALQQTGKFAAVAALVATAIASSSPAYPVSNIDPLSTGNKYGWSENTGWMNLAGDTANGVTVAPDYLSGFAWLENYGWVNFGAGTPAGPGNHYTNSSAADFGVNKGSTGNLSGYAWGENIGWIVFDTTDSSGSKVMIDPVSGKFSGYAWGENIGWIAFTGVPTDAVAQAPSFSSRIEDWTMY